MGQLYEKMKTDLKLRRYSPRTEKSYLWCAQRFARHFMRAPSEQRSSRRPRRAGARRTVPATSIRWESGRTWTVSA